MVSNNDPSVSATDVYRDLTAGVWTPLNKMKKSELEEECKMWRNLWGWIPSEIKYYAARTGSMIGVQVRNYHRFVAVLLETKWDLKTVEIGTYEKVYDQNDGQYYFERKIVRLPVSQIVAWDWIAERTREEDMYPDEDEEADEENVTQ